jgi:hypothetical protein
MCSTGLDCRRPVLHGIGCRHHEFHRVGGGTLVATMKPNWWWWNPTGGSKMTAGGFVAAENRGGVEP